MHIELQNVVFGPNSQETYNFTANLVIDGTDVAYVSNGGTGGAHSIHPYNRDCRNIVDKAGQYAKQLAPVEMFGRMLPMDLDFYISLELIRMSNTKRENGYYWVKINAGWRIFHWSGDCWYHIGGLATFQDDELQEINEQRLLSPDEHQKIS